MDIRKTEVYRANAPLIRRQDRREFARMLGLAKKTKCRFDPSAKMIITAFVWSETPQGHEYWWTLHMRLKGATT